MIIPILALIPLALAIALTLTFLLRAAGHRMGHLDSAGSAGHTKTDLRPIPNIGGIAIVGAVLLPAVLGMIAVQFSSDETITSIVPQLAPHLEGVTQRIPMAGSLFVAVLFLHITGLIDDRKALGPAPKVIVQCIAALLVVLIPFEQSQATRLLTMLDTVPGLAPLAPWPSIIVTIIWLVVIINAINFMDNMDGLAAGVSAIASALFFVAAVLNEQWFIAAMLALLIGALLGFLVFNLPPASIFMGDGGSLVVGLLLGFLTVRTTWIDPTRITPTWYTLFMPVIVLAVPLYDLISVVTLRLAQGRSPFVGDQQHFSHRLLLQGLSARRTLCIIYGVTLATGITGILLGSLTHTWQALLAVGQVFVLLGLLAIYEHAIRKPRSTDGDRR